MAQNLLVTLDLPMVFVSGAKRRISNRRTSGNSPQEPVIAVLLEKFEQQNGHFPLFVVVRDPADQAELVLNREFVAHPDHGNGVANPLAPVVVGILDPEGNFRLALRYSKYSNRLAFSTTGMASSAVKPNAARCILEFLRIERLP